MIDWNTSFHFACNLLIIGEHLYALLLYSFFFFICSATTAHEEIICSLGTPGSLLGKSALLYLFASYLQSIWFFRT